jgi:hypothetical protein
MKRLALLLALSLAPAAAPAAEQLDWVVEEAPAGPVLEYARDVRDGVLGLLDCAMDLQLGLFSEVALVAGAATMGLSDVTGLVDDNPVTEHVLKSQVSKSLARTSYLLHVVGAESVLGSHGLETEWYLEAAFTEMNPLLAGQPEEPSIPLEPLAFFSEALVHPRVYGAHLPGSVALASLAADGVVRPAGSLLRLFGLRRASLAIERFGQGLVRRVVR